MQLIFSDFTFQHLKSAIPTDRLYLTRTYTPITFLARISRELWTKFIGKVHIKSIMHLRSLVFSAFYLSLSFSTFVGTMSRNNEPEIDTHPYFLVAMCNFSHELYKSIPGSGKALTGLTGRRGVVLCCPSNQICKGKESILCCPPNLRKWIK